MNFGVKFGPDVWVKAPEGDTGESGVVKVMGVVPTLL